MSVQMSKKAFLHITVSVLVALSALVVAACDSGGEGDRCNPDLSHDECGDGLSCQQPGTCVESYCCPSDLATSSNPYCNGQACPAASTDAGDTADADAVAPVSAVEGGADHD